MDKLERVARAIKDAGDWMFEEDELYRMAQAAIAALEPVTVRTCARCGHPENNHPYRHPFVALAERGE